MAETRTSMHHSPEPTIPARYERKDIDLVRIALSAAILTVTITVVCIVSRWFLAAFVAPAGQTSTILADEQQLPPEPRLEGIDRMPAATSSDAQFQSWSQLRAAQQLQLESYGWVDRQKGIVHIPVEAAMKIIVENKLLSAEAAPSNLPETPNSNTRP